MSIVPNHTREESQELYNVIFEGLKRRYKEERRGIHVTDLLWPRLVAYNKLVGNAIGPREVLFYTLGRIHGETIEGLIGTRNEVMVVRDNIIGTPDAVREETTGEIYPVEIKTTRTTDEDSIVKTHYIFQLAAYCWIMRKNYGYLIVLRLNNDSDPLRVYKVSFKDEDLEKFGEELKRRRDALLCALEARDPFLAPCVRNDPELGWRCRNCPLRQECEKRDSMLKNGNSGNKT